MLTHELRLQKYQVIKELHDQHNFPVSLLCQYAVICRSAYYKWLNRKPNPAVLLSAKILDEVCKLYADVKGIYGYRRITMEINKKLDTHYNYKRIYRLMKMAGLKAVIRKKRKTYLPSKPQVIAENILNREFKADLPNQKWLTDVTEFKLKNDKKAYLSAILDLGDRRIVAYELGNSNNNQLVFDTFEKAVNFNSEAHPLVHSDRGIQYTNKEFKNRLDRFQAVQSMSRVGRCIDNGPMEGFWGIIKSEMPHLYAFNDFAELKLAIKKYVNFYNTKRLQIRLNGLTPHEYHDFLVKQNRAA